MSYITETYDFSTAITAHLTKPGDKRSSFDILKVDAVTDAISIVTTTHGTFWCESSEYNDRIFMSVTPLIRN